MSRLLTVDGLDFSYQNGASVFKKASFNLERGVIYGLIAPNGSGKTTLIDLLFGHLKGSPGSIRWNEGTDDMFYLKQHIDIPRSLKIQEFVELVLRLNTKQYSETSLAFYSTPEWSQRYRDIKRKRAGKLSGGERRWICVMCALSVQRNALFLDEPTTSMDTISRMQVWEHLSQRVKAHDATVLMTSHHMDEIRRFADRILLIKDYAIEKHSNVDEFVSKYSSSNDIDDAFIQCFA